jgi:NAD(P)-dependent dehydrogenase (short-subunit alcohol dehydrogenase family)
MKNVIITGSSNGFGLKAAKDFADKGYQVFAIMRNPNGKMHFTVGYSLTCAV